MMPDDQRATDDADLRPPLLPVRAAIYIDNDGVVRFGALFEGLVEVARALDPAAPLPPRDGEAK